MASAQERLLDPPGGDEQPSTGLISRLSAPPGHTVGLIWKIEVLGHAEPAGSKRAFVNPKTQRAIVTDANKKSAPWKAQVSAAAIEQRPEWIQGPLKAPICLTVTFVRLRPRGHYGRGRNADRLLPSAPAHPTTRPDTTKLLRGVEDALTGIAWQDDAQVVLQVARKRFVEPGEVEHVVIEIATL